MCTSHVNELGDFFIVNSSSFKDVLIERSLLLDKVKWNDVSRISSRQFLSACVCYVFVFNLIL